MADLTYKLFADYFQFLLMDEHCEDDFSAVWSEAALDRMLALGPTSASIRTLRNADVSVGLHIFDVEPSLDIDHVDHAALGSFSIPSGQIVIMGCTDFKPTAARFAIPPGSYHVMTAVTGVETIEYELEPAEDRYFVYLWPGAPIEPRLLKHWKSQASERGGVAR